jgi:DNA-binding response OmpR family regulator
LIVEDDLSLAESLCQFLDENGYRTVTASTGRQGWELLLESRPQLCLLDLNLPDGSGLDLLRQIISRHLDVQVVVMTAFDLMHLRPKSANRVLAAWLTKPVNPLDLLKIVERCMGQQMTAAGTA